MCSKGLRAHNEGVSGVICEAEARVIERRRIICEARVVSREAVSDTDYYSLAVR